MSGKALYKINVRTLAEYLFLDGNLGAMAPAGKSAQSGIKAHQKMQDRGIEGYLAEVELVHLFPGERLDLELSGRADGIYEKDGLIHIEEIKSTRREASELRPQEYPAHAAQLGIYGWLYCLDRHLERISLDLIYVHRRSQKQRIFSTVKTLVDLEESYGPVVQAFLSWQDRQEGYRQDLRTELSTFGFPFAEFRPRQRDAAKEVFRAIRDRGTLFLQAPTGLGKTMAVLYPALKALGLGYAAKLFFFTAKNSGAAAAEKALFLIAAKLPHLRWISITAKGKICFLIGSEGTGRREDLRPPCESADCPYARDYYRKLKHAILELYEHTCFTRKLIEEIAHKYFVCPFELSLDLSLHCDVIVADYNYGFDYGAKLKRFFLNGKTDFVFLVDEAHNLIDRARSMFSASLSKRRILEIRRTCSPLEKKILSRLNSVLLERKKDLAPDHQDARELFPAGIDTAVNRAIDGFDDLIESGATLSDQAIVLYWELGRLRTVLEKYDNSYRTILSTRNRDFSLDFLCIDPSAQLQEVLRNQNASVFFSGTLAPASYFTTLIAPDLNPEFIDLPSPFPSENCAYLLKDGLSTRWRDREKNRKRYAQAIEESFAAVSGNLIVFSPSFAFQEALLSQLLRNDPIPESWVIQKPGMTPQEKEDFVAAFQAFGGLRGFAVAGGSFAESIDLVGEALVGVLIFGVGLPQVNFFNDTFRAFFEAKFGNGYAWAYLNPGLHRVLQAAGRVIRSEEDRGFVYLLDERYATVTYRSLLPRHWDLKRISKPGDFVRGLPAGLARNAHPE